MSDEEEIDELEQELDKKIREMNQFRQEMQARRVKAELEEENPFKLPKTSALDRQLEALHKE